MKILAVHDGHNATACFLEDGEIVSMVSEERFTNIKNQGGFPFYSIEWILKTQAISMADFDYIVFPHLVSPVMYPYNSQFEWGKRDLFMQVNQIFPKSLIGSPSLVGPYIKLFKGVRVSTLKSYSQKFGFDFEKVCQVEHHTSHGYAALYGSDYSVEEGDVLVFTCDDSGDGLSSTVASWSMDEGYRILQQTSSFHSIGDLYARVTQYLGMKAGEHEYKVMGIAPYVSEESSQGAYYKFLEYIRFDSKNGAIKKNRLYGKRMLKQMKSDFFMERFDNICGGLQRVFEHVVVSWVRYWAQLTGIRTAVFGGGSFMNVKANMLISQLKELDSVYFCPSSGDESTAMGAAFYVAQKKGEKKIEPLKSLYKGPSYNRKEVEAALEKYKDQTVVEKPADIDVHTAGLLADGKIIARFRGPAEWGARALGNRSILCRADDPRIISTLNKAIKMRDFWMPFAPSILEEDSDRYLSNPNNIFCPNMTLTFETNKEARDEIISALHPYDFSCRPQIVNKETNQSYHRLILSFKRLTGYSGLLNTSFNLHGSPIVGAPENALNTLMASRIDYLVLEDYLVQAKPGDRP